MLGDLGRKQKEAMAQRFLESEQAEALFSIITEVERSLVASVKEQHAALGIETIGALPDPEDRAAELRQVALAKINGRFPAHVVETYLADRLENAEEAAEFAALDGDEWEETKTEWAEGYRSQGVEGTDAELARAHVRTRYGVDLDAFEELVVEWPAEREAAELERILTSGLKTAHNGITRTTAVLDAAEIDVQDDVVVSDP